MVVTYTKLYIKFDNQLMSPLNTPSTKHNTMYANTKKKIPILYNLMFMKQIYGKFC
jgi:hypothetical protein